MDLCFDLLFMILMHAWIKHGLNVHWICTAQGVSMLVDDLCLCVTVWKVGLSRCREGLMAIIGKASSQ